MLGYTDYYFHATWTCKPIHSFWTTVTMTLYSILGCRSPSTPGSLPARRHHTYRHPEQIETTAVHISNYHQENSPSELGIKAITSHQPLHNPPQWIHMNRKKMAASHKNNISAFNETGILLSLSTTEIVSLTGIEPTHIPTSSLTINNITNRYKIKSKTKINR